jgi:glycosyltransferase involved in cell wall biosynthesis
MSDVMPYESSRFSELTADRLESYERAWKEHLGRAIAESRPDLIHSHHVWLVSSWLKDVAPEVPVVTQCHATGLRQMELAPHLATGVEERVSRNDRFLVLHEGHAAELARTLAVPRERIEEVGAGYDEGIFHLEGRDPAPGPRLLYVGKLSAAKGLPWLLDAVERLAASGRDLQLHVAGAGAGREAARLEERIASLAPLVTHHGQLDQPSLADLMRRSSVCVLPSFYEGLPLVLVEALACGCRLVSTRLPGVTSRLAPHLGDALATVQLPRLEGTDVPVPEDLPSFVDALAAALAAALEKPPVEAGSGALRTALAPFTWDAVFARVERIWRRILGGHGGGA